MSNPMHAANSSSNSVGTRRCTTSCDSTSHRVSCFTKLSCRCRIPNQRVTSYGTASFISTPSEADRLLGHVAKLIGMPRYSRHVGQGSLYSTTHHSLTHPLLLSPQVLVSRRRPSSSLAKGDIVRGRHILPRTWNRRRTATARSARGRGRRGASRTNG